MQKVSFELSVTESKSKLNALLSVVNTSMVLPILGSIRVVKNGLLKFHATDLENEVVVVVPSEKSEDFDICVEAHVFKSFLNNSISDIVSFSGNESRVTVEQDGFKAKVAPENSSNFPESVVLKEVRSVKINSKNLCALLHQAIPFVSNDDLRPAMTGINIVDWKGELYIVSTDAHKMFYKPLMKTPTEFKNISVVIPVKCARLFTEMFKDEEIEIKVNNSYIEFSGNEQVLRSRLIGAKYPNFEQVIVSCTLKFSLLRKQLNSFLSISKNFANLSTRQVILEVDKNKIKFNGGDVDFERYFEFELPIYNPNKEFDDFRFAVNILYLKEALVVNKKDKYVLIEHTMSDSKGFIVDGCVLLMPMVLNDNY